MALPLTFTLTSPSLPSLPSLLLLRRSPPPSPSLSLPPFSSSSSSRLSPPSLQLQLQFVARASTPDLGKRIQFEQDDPPLIDIDTDTDTDTTGGQGPDGFDGGSGDNGGGGSGGDGDGEHFEEEEEEEPNKKKKMLMSQQFTLAYAALVGVGGIMGFLKKGSMKSAAAGGLSSLLLCYVYTQLPTNPTFASSLGLGISGALLTIMGSRFMKSGKIFPAGVVSLVSLFMTGGYLHAILRAGH